MNVCVWGTVRSRGCRALRDQGRVLESLASRVMGSCELPWREQSLQGTVLCKSSMCFNCWAPILSMFFFKKYNFVGLEYKAHCEFYTSQFPWKMIQEQVLAKDPSPIPWVRLRSSLSNWLNEAKALLKDWEPCVIPRGSTTTRLVSILHSETSALRDSLFTCLSL